MRCGSFSSAPIVTLPSAARLELGGDFAVVTRRARKGFAREPQPRGQSQLALLAQFRGDGSVVFGVGDHSHALKILRRGAHHRRAPDVDVFDQLFGAHARLARRGGEGIKVHHHQIDRHDAMLFRLLAVSGLPALKQDPAVNFRVQRLHPPAQHLRPPGQLRHVAHRNRSFAQKPRRAAGRNDFDAKRGKHARKFHDPSFVVNADKRSFHSHRSLPGICRVD